MKERQTRISEEPSEILTGQAPADAAANKIYYDAYRNEVNVTKSGDDAIENMKRIAITQADARC